jgi:hypothetical protein
MEGHVRQEVVVVLPYSVVKDLPTPPLSPVEVVPQRKRRSRPIVDYSFYGINQDFYISRVPRSHAVRSSS